VRRAIIGASIFAFAFGVALGQAAPSAQPAPEISLKPSFEVASVRPHATVLVPGEGGSRSAGFPGLSISGTRVTVTQTVTGLIMEAYAVRENQISGGPDWISHASGGVGANFYDISAKAPGDRTPTGDEVQQMLQTLLADRFRLKLHREMKDLPIYALVTGKNGPKLKENTGDRSVGGGGGGGVGLKVRIARTGASTADLALLLSNYADRPVVDQTGLTGYYDFTLEFDRDNGARGPAGGASIFTAIQEQLGLKLEAVKQSIELLVVEHVEKPSEN
jgi:uncharacterized protein (TIGR03435 family)